MTYFALPLLHSRCRVVSILRTLRQLLQVINSLLATISKDTSFSDNSGLSIKPGLCPYGSLSLILLSLEFILLIHEHQKTCGWAACSLKLWQYFVELYIIFFVSIPWRLCFPNPSVLGLHPSYPWILKMCGCIVCISNLQHYFSP